MTTTQTISDLALLLAYEAAGNVFGPPPGGGPYGANVQGWVGGLALGIEGAVAVTTGAHGDDDATPADVTVARRVVRAAVAEVAPAGTGAATTPAPAPADPYEDHPDLGTQMVRNWVRDVAGDYACEVGTGGWAEAYGLGLGDACLAVAGCVTEAAETEPLTRDHLAAIETVLGPWLARHARLR